MPYQQVGDIKYLQSDLLESEPVTQAMFTRHGGVSPQPWDSLNFGSTVGDELKNVAVNRQKALDALGLDDDSVFDVWQVHSRAVAVAGAPRPPEEKHQKADIILTDRPGVVLLMRFADCVPLLFYDPRRHVAGIAHAGWQGTVKNVAGAAVQALHDRFHSQPEDLIGVIGPSIGPDHYPIGTDVVDQVNTAFGQEAVSVLSHQNGHVHLDLWLANRIQLEQAGVKKIETTQICTACHLQDWYSHRGQHGKTGRFGALISLRG